MNTTTPRVFIAATRQNDGKTTASLGLIAALQPHYPRVGYIKPVGQRFVEIEEQKIDEVSLNRALFEKEGVEIIGVIINKVVGTKLEYVSDFARRGFKRKGLELLGVIPHQRILCSPTLDSIREELQAEILSETRAMP